MPSPLRQELTFVSATALVVSNMIGTGIFTTTGFLAGDLGRPSLVIAIWLVGAVVAMAGCLSYAELGINFPQSGGEYVYLKEAWGPGWGFLSGWISFFAGFAAPVAAGALAFSEYLGHFIPSLSVQAQVPVFGFLHIGAGRLVAVAVIGVFALVNVLGLRLAANLQTVLTGFKIGVLGAFLALAFLVGHGDWNHFTLAAQRTSAHGVGAQFAVSLIFVMFAYSGWNAATYVAEEMKDPQRTLPLALITGTLIVTVFYLALNVAFIYALPLESLKGVVRVGAEAATALFGTAGGGIFSGIMAVGILSCVSAMVLVGPRVYYAMARDGYFFAGAGKVHSRWHTPVRAILYQAIASGVMVLTGTFERLIYYIGFALILFAALATAGIFRVRRRPDWKRLRAVSWGYPLVPGVFIGASLWMLIYTLFLRPIESFLGLLTMGAGGLVYRFMFRKSHPA
ncbi:MAG TPA: amino acid permease [Terriglobia bacterium]|nr:amino acid permease [Terriglobia bacterium]